MTILDLKAFTYNERQIYFSRFDNNEISNDGKELSFFKVQK
jgi:hypothetical protein